jgi:hypothetical protein
MDENCPASDHYTPESIAHYGHLHKLLKKPIPTHSPSHGRHPCLSLRDLFVGVGPLCFWPVLLWEVSPRDMLLKKEQTLVA